MLTASIRRTAVLVSLVAALATPWASAAGPGAGGLRPAHAVESATPDFLDLVFRFFRTSKTPGLKEGCHLDPNGRCSYRHGAASFNQRRVASSIRTASAFHRAHLGLSDEGAERFAFSISAMIRRTSSTVAVSRLAASQKRDSAASASRWIFLTRKIASISTASSLTFAVCPAFSPSMARSSEASAAS